MKDLTEKEFLAAPAKVQFVYVAASLKQPIGFEMLDSAIRENPEYFPEEVEHRRKWALMQITKIKRNERDKSV